VRRGAACDSPVTEAVSAKRCTNFMSFSDTVRGLGFYRWCGNFFELFS
jgi:hypothetical protein